MRARKALSVLFAAATLFATHGYAQPADPRPIRGPWKPDLPLAKAYDTAARALAMADDNPLIRWEYRVWCETGYRHPGEEGRGPVGDQRPHPTPARIEPPRFF